MLKGIDVSYANGRVDWDKLKGNIDFAILRCGYGSDKFDQKDKQWARNVAECNRLGIPWDVYLYSYAMTVKEAESEAAHALLATRRSAVESVRRLQQISAVSSVSASPLPVLQPEFTGIKIGRSIDSICSSSPSGRSGWHSIIAK